MHVGKDLVAAAATPLVLGILAEGESYGYAILRRVAELSEGELQFSDGMLYPLLHRLERLGQIESHWSTDSGRPRKHYRLSTAGSLALAEHRAQWGAVSRTLRNIWHTDGPGVALGGA